MNDGSMNSFTGHDSFFEENAIQNSDNDTEQRSDVEEESNNDTASFLNNLQNLDAVNNAELPNAYENFVNLVEGHFRFSNLEMYNSAAHALASIYRQSSHRLRHPQVDFDSNRNQSSFESQLEEVFNEICLKFSKENEKLSDHKAVLGQKKVTFEEYVKFEKKKINKERTIMEKNNEKIGQSLDPNIVLLNVGGTHKITTTKTTLCKAADSALAAMFNGMHKLKTYKGRVFIDRDGDTFCKLISYLRSNKLPSFDDKGQESLFYEELDYWGIALGFSCGNFEEFDSAWCTPTLTLDANGMIAKKNDPLHGIVFCKYPISHVNNYIELRVVSNKPQIPTKSSFFIGLVDRSLYHKEQLMSTYWKDSPSSFYYDVWNCRLEKIDEKGKQAGIALEYGCGCKEEGENILGMLYDEENETLTFYKNGVCMGAAFHNVPKGLYPAIDVWFESGHVEILKRNKPNTKKYL